MDYQKKSNLKIGVSGSGKNYLKMPWSIEDTMENLEELKEMMQQKLIMKNYHARGEKDAEELAFDFDRAINALKENQEYKKLGTLEEVQVAVEKQRAKKPNKVGTEGCRYIDTYRCPTCGGIFTGTGIAGYCYHCGQKLNWTEAENK